MRRRDFLKYSAAAATGCAAGTTRLAASSSTQVSNYVELGKTGLVVSDIAFGGSRLSDSKLVRHAFERGVTFFDTAESYRNGRSETAVGKALAGKRDDVIIASKTKAWANQTKGAMMHALESSLKRLQTDYVDIYYNHAVNDVDRMQNDEWLEFTEQARRQGKIRFRGMSGHGAKLAECLEYALDEELVDVVLVAFNFAQDPKFQDKLKQLFHFVALQPELIKQLGRAKQKGVGITAMKTLMGARLNDMRPYEGPGVTFSQSALRWTLASGHVDVAVISMTDFDLIDEYVGASGGMQVSSSEFNLLARYVAFQGDRYCQQGCAVCADSCPKDVAISDVLRSRMYDVDYGDRQLALDSYAAIDHDATACLACSEQPCLTACPNQIPIPFYTKDAAANLRFA